MGYRDRLEKTMNNSKKEDKPPDHNNINGQSTATQNGNGDNKTSKHVTLDEIFSLLDGATSQTPAIAPELDSQKKIAADPDQPLDKRLEAFEA